MTTFKRRAIIAGVLASITLYPLLAARLTVVDAYRQSIRQAKASELVALADQAKGRIEGAITRMQDTVQIISSHSQLYDSLNTLENDPETSMADLHLVMHAAAAALSSSDRILLFDNNLRPLAAYTGQSGQLSEHGATLDAAIGVLQNHPSHKTQIDPARIGNRLYIVGHKTIQVEQQVAGHVAIVFDTQFLREIINANAGLGRTGEWLFAIRGENDQAVFAMPLRYDPSAAFVRTVSADRLDVPITQALLGHETVMDNAPDYREKAVLAVTRYLDEVDWGLVAKIDEAEVMAPFHAANRTLLGIAAGSLAMLIAGGVVIFYVLRRSHAPKQPHQRTVHLHQNEHRDSTATQAVSVG